MKDIIDISIVMPVYNASAYLDKSITSILKQSFTNYELICVDDGSTDNSLEIISNYQKIDNRVKVICQKNSFAGAARNAGLKIAKGKYVLFLDSDDYFKKNMLSNLFATAERVHSQIIIFGYYYFFDNNKTFKQPFSLKAGMYSSDELGEVLYQRCGAVPWNKFLLKSYIDSENVLFQEIQNNNDEFFSRAIVTNASKIYFLNKRFVYYRTNNKNSLQGSISKNITCFGEALIMINDFLSCQPNITDNKLKSFHTISNSAIEQHLNLPLSQESFTSLLIYVTDRLIPVLFSSQSEMSPFVKAISTNKEKSELLYSVMTYYRDSFVNCKCTEYRIGKKLVSFLKKILRYK